MMVKYIFLSSSNSFMSSVSIIIASLNTTSSLFIKSIKKLTHIGSMIHFPSFQLLLRWVCYLLPSHRFFLVLFFYDNILTFRIFCLYFSRILKYASHGFNSSSSSLAPLSLAPLSLSSHHHPI